MIFITAIIEFNLKINPIVNVKHTINLCLPSILKSLPLIQLTTRYPLSDIPVTKYNVRRFIRKGIMVFSS